jgi:Cu/Ag efflux pump CusA
VSALLLGTAIVIESMIDAAIMLVENDARPFLEKNFVMLIL